MFFLIYYPLVGTAAYVAVTAALMLVAEMFPIIPYLPFVARCLSSYGSLLFCAAYGVISSIALSLVGYKGLAQWTTARAFSYTMALTTGISFKVLGDGKKILSSKRPVVIIGNHQTELDVLLLGAIFPPYCSVTAKKSLAKVPFLGWFMSLSGTVFIDRVDRTQAMKAFEGAAKTMKDKSQSVFIFPEGTRSYADGPSLLPFKKGAFHLAVQAGVDILPVVAENYSKVLSVRRKTFNAGTIRVKGEC